MLEKVIGYIGRTAGAFMLVGVLGIYINAAETKKPVKNIFDELVEKEVAKIKDTISKRAMPNQSKKVKIRKSFFGKDAGLIGAALLVKENSTYFKNKTISE